jgi:pyruvate kinase
MKNTKILATISDKKCDIEFLKKLHDNGLNGVRINTAHQIPEDTQRIINNVRKISENIAIVIDTKGPEIRTRGIEEPISLKIGEKIKIYKDKFSFSTEAKSFYTSYDGFIDDIDKGKSILIDDGDVELEVISKKDNALICKATNEGQIKKNKSINVPGVRIKLPSLTKKDKMYINYAIEQDVDFIAHSFVRNKKDVIGIQKMLDAKNSRIKIIAKIENQEGVDNIDEILDHVYGIMIARGDLAIEIPAQKIPSIQKMIVDKCKSKKKLVITATQMLHTMIENPRPTRAEVSDIANAVYDGTDVLMLSGETAYGEYPIEAVQMMAMTAIEIEKSKKSVDTDEIVKINDEIATYLAHSAIEASQKLHIKAIIADTLTGRTALYLSAFRGKVPIHMQCYDKRVMRELCLSYGIRTKYAIQEETTTPTKFIRTALKPLLKEKLISENDRILVLAGSFGASHGASFIEISSAKNMMRINEKTKQKKIIK